ncbi:MAG: F0F1 ATP synthase subunit delta [Chloroflexi bacterium]|nr:F0F1 ATP synthase subunit delta [Chloroflexota bacterium]
MDDSLSEKTVSNLSTGAAEGPDEVTFPVLALVRVAVPLRPDEKEALSRVLSRFAGGPVELKVEVTPEIIGGVWVRVGDKVIDGTLRRRLEALRQHLIAQCRALVTDHLNEESHPTAEGQA